MKFKGLFLFNIISLSIYFSVCIFVLNHIGINEIIFSSSDSNEYKDFGMWLLNSQNGYCSFVRPFFYPLISQISFHFAGAIGIWIMQFIFYMISINLVFISIYKTTQNRLLSFIGGFILSSNLTFIVMTMHGLTEITVVFILSILVYYIVLLNQKKVEFKNLLVIVFLICLLTVIKPVFLIFFWISLIALIVKHYKILGQWINILLFVVSLSPLLIQVSIMKMNHEEFFISKIGKITLRDYYYKKLYADVNNIPYNPSTGASDADFQKITEITKDASTMEILKFALDNPLTSIKTYFEILLSNINTHSEIINGLRIISFSKWMDNVNTAYFFIHLFFLGLIVFFFKKIFRFFDSNSWILFSVYFASCYILLISGISFWQGDRLVLPAMPLWIFIYSVLTQFILKNIPYEKI